MEFIASVGDESFEVGFGDATDGIYVCGRAVILGEITAQTTHLST